MSCIRMEIIPEATLHPRLFFYAYAHPPITMRHRLFLVFQMDIPFDSVHDLIGIGLERMSQQIALCGRGIEVAWNGT